MSSSGDRGRRGGSSAPVGPPYTTVDAALAASGAYADLSPSLQQQLSSYDYRSRLIRHSVSHVRGYHQLPETIKSSVPERKYYELMVNIGLDRLQLYPYAHIKQLVEHAGETPLSYYTTMLSELLKSEKSYDTLPNFTAVDILNLLGIGRNQYLEITKVVRGKLRWRVNRSFVKDHLPSEMLPTTMLDPFWILVLTTSDMDTAKRLCKTEEELSLFKMMVNARVSNAAASSSGAGASGSSVLSTWRMKLSTPILKQGSEPAAAGSSEKTPGNSATNRTAPFLSQAESPRSHPNLSFRSQSSDGGTSHGLTDKKGEFFACELPHDAAHALYRRGLAYAIVEVQPTECIFVPPLENFVMNRTSDDPQEMLLYRILATIDERTPLELLAQLLSTDHEEICSAVAVYIRLGLAQRKRVLVPPFLMDHQDSVVHASWKAMVDPLIAAALADADDEAGMGRSTSNMDCGGSSSAPVSTQLRPQRRIALLFDASLTGFLMMTNLSSDPTFKQHAVTLFEAGKLTDEQMGPFIEKLEKCGLPQSSSGGGNAMSDEAAEELFGGEAQRYISTVCCLRESIKCLRNLCLADTEDGDAAWSAPPVGPFGHRGDNDDDDDEARPGAMERTLQAIDRPTTPCSPDRRTDAPTDHDGSDVGDAPILSDPAVEAGPSDIPSPLPKRQQVQPAISENPLSPSTSGKPKHSTSRMTTTGGGGFRSVTPSKLARGVDLIKVESINELEGKIRYMLLHRNYWAYFTVSPIAQAPLLHEAVENLYGSMVNIMPSTWLLLFLYSVTGEGPACVLYPFGARVTRVNKLLQPKRGHSTKLRLLPLSMDAEPVEVSPQNALVILNEMTSTAPLFAMRLSDTSRELLPDGTVTDGSPDTFHVEVRIPFSADRSDMMALLQKAIARKRGIASSQLVRIAVDGLPDGSTVPGSSGTDRPSNSGCPPSFDGDELSAASPATRSPTTSEAPSSSQPTAGSLPGGLIHTVEAAVRALHVDCSVGNFNVSCLVTTFARQQKRLHRRATILHIRHPSTDCGGVRQAAVPKATPVPLGNIASGSLADESSMCSGMFSPLASPYGGGGDGTPSSQPNHDFCVMRATIIDIGFGLPLHSVDCCNMILSHIPGLLTEPRMEKHSAATKYLSQAFGGFLEQHSNLSLLEREKIPLMSSGMQGGKRGPSTQQHLRTVGSDLSGVPLPSKTVLFDGTVLVSVDADDVATGEL